MCGIRRLETGPCSSFFFLLSDPTEEKTCGRCVWLKRNQFVRVSCMEAKPSLWMVCCLSPLSIGILRADQRVGPMGGFHEGGPLRQGIEISEGGAVERHGGLGSFQSRLLT